MAVAAIRLHPNRDGECKQDKHPTTDHFCECEVLYRSAGNYHEQNVASTSPFFKKEISMMNKDIAKKTARALEKALASLGHELKHGQALDIVASLSGFSHFGALPKAAAEAAPAETALAPLPRALRLPSVDGGYYDRFVLVPPDMGYMAARTYANQVIAAVNFEDHEREECLDGESVEDNIRRRLEARGYVWPNVDTTPDCWDEYNEQSLAEPENWEEVRQHFGLPADLEIRNEEKHIYAWKYGSRDEPGIELDPNVWADWPAARKFFHLPEDIQPSNEVIVKHVQDYWAALVARGNPSTPERTAEADDLSCLHVWRATLYLDGQSVIGAPRIALRLDKRDLREAMLDEYWDDRLNATEATPTVHIEQLDDGTLTGPFEVWIEDCVVGTYDSMAVAVNQAAGAVGPEVPHVWVTGKDSDGEETEIVTFRSGEPALL